MWDIIAYIFFVALFIWFFSLLEKIKNILSAINDKVSSLEYNLSNELSNELSDIKNKNEVSSLEYNFSIGSIKIKLDEIVWELRNSLK